MPRTPAWAPDKLLVAAVAALALAPPGGAVAQTRPDLVASDRLRVCADPADMPFSNKAGEGFDNKIAAIVADELKLPLHYYWMPRGPGFVRNSLGTDLCDVIIGYASGDEIVDGTNPYYASTYVLVTKKAGPLDGVDRLEDPRLKGRRLGVVAATPPYDHLLRLGLAANAKSYPLVVDHRFSSPGRDAVQDVESGATDAAILWGPIGGYFARSVSTALAVTPLIETARPLLAFRIAFGVRHHEIDWKHRLNAVIRKRQKDIDAALAELGAPLLPIAAAPAEFPPTIGARPEKSN